jgi:hypothetical protein
LRALLVVIGLLGGTSAHATDIPPERQTMILTRALAYDNNLRGRVGDSVVVAIVFKSGSSASESAADSMLKAWKPLESAKVQDLPFRVVKVAYSSRESLKSAIGPQGIDALYCCPGLEGDLGAIRELSHKEHVLTIGAREEFVQGGISLGVFVVDGKMTVTINLPASREEGASFSSELLRLAHVIR